MDRFYFRIIFIFFVILILFLSNYKYFLTTNSKKKKALYFILTILTFIFSFLISTFILYKFSSKLFIIELYIENFMSFYYWIISVSIILIIQNVILFKIFNKFLKKKNVNSEINDIGTD